MIEKWYRGHEGSKNTTDNFGIIWLADDPEYAQLYADEYPDGVVSTVFVNMDKINYLDWYYDEDFDPYDPDMSLIKIYMEEQGCNAYTFPLNDGVTVLALLSTEPIIKVEKTIIENKKYRNMKIRLTESKLKAIIKESVMRVLLENDNNWDYEDFLGDEKEEYGIISIPINLLEEIFPGEYDTDRFVDGMEITYHFDRMGSPLERKKFFEYCKRNEELFHTYINVYDYDDCSDVESITNVDNIVNYIKQYPNKRMVKYFMRELKAINNDGAEFYRFYAMENGIDQD